MDQDSKIYRWICRWRHFFETLQKLAPVPSSDLSRDFFWYVLVFQVRIHLLAQHDGDAASVTHSLSAWYYPSWFTRRDHSEIRHKRSKREILNCFYFRWSKTLFDKIFNWYGQKRYNAVIGIKWRLVKSALARSDWYFGNLMDSQNWLILNGSKLKSRNNILDACRRSGQKKYPWNLTDRLRYGDSFILVECMTIIHLPEKIYS